MIDRVSLWALTRYWQLRDREQGQAAVEYGVLLALILVVAIAVIATVGTQVENAFTSVSKKLP